MSKGTQKKFQIPRKILPAFSVVRNGTASREIRGLIAVSTWRQQGLGAGPLEHKSAPGGEGGGGLGTGATDHWSAELILLETTATSRLIKLFSAGPFFDAEINEILHSSGPRVHATELARGFFRVNVVG